MTKHWRELAGYPADLLSIEAGATVLDAETVVMASRVYALAPVSIDVRVPWRVIADRTTASDVEPAARVEGQIDWALVAHVLTRGRIDFEDPEVLRAVSMVGECEPEDVPFLLQREQGRTDGQWCWPRLVVPGAGILLGHSTAGALVLTPRRAAGRDDSAHTLVLDPTADVADLFGEVAMVNEFNL